MKIQAVQCPKCKANLQLGSEKETPNGIYYCQYCGTLIHIDDEIKRSEHVYKKVDVARILEAENEKTRISNEENQNKLKRRIVAIVVMAIAFLILANVVKETASNIRSNSVKKKVVQIVNDNGMEISNYYDSSTMVTMDIKTDTYQKEVIDKVQGEIVPQLLKLNKHSVYLSFEKNNEEVRCVIINNGVASIMTDRTNTVGDSEIDALVKKYDKAIRNALTNYPMDVDKVSFENDGVVIILKSDSNYSETLNNVEDEIVKLNDDLDKQNVLIEFHSSNNLIRETKISTDGTIKREDDYSNSYTEEEEKRIIDEYLAATAKVCNHHTAEVKMVVISKNKLRITIINTTNNKLLVDVLQNELLSSMKKLTAIDTELLLCSNTYSTARRIKIDDNHNAVTERDETKILNMFDD